MKTPSGTRLNVSRSAAVLVVVLAFIVTGSSWWLPDRQTVPVSLAGAAVLAVAAPDVRMDVNTFTQARVDVRPPWSPVVESDEGLRMLVSSIWQPVVPPPGLTWEADERFAGLLLGRWVNAGVADEEAPPAARAEPYDGMLDISSVRVMRGEEVVRACTKAFGRHRCGPDEWNWVGPTTQMIAGESQTCTWLHPHGEGALVLRLDVSAEYGRLDLELALSDHAAQARTDEIEVAVNLDGEGIRSTRSSLTVVPRSGWQALEVVLPEGHTGVDINIAITTDEPGLGHLCGRASVTSAHERSGAVSSRRGRASTARLEGLVRSRVRWLGLSSPRWMRVVRGLFRSVVAAGVVPGAEP